MKTTYTITEILNSERGRLLVDAIEEAEAEVRGREIDPEDESEFWARALKTDINTLRWEFGYDWELDQPWSPERALRF